MVPGAAPGAGSLCAPSPGNPYCPLLSYSPSLWISHDVTSWPPLLTSPEPEWGASWDPSATCMAPLAAPAQLPLADGGNPSTQHGKGCIGRADGHRENRRRHTGVL